MQLTGKLVAALAVLGLLALILHTTSCKSDPLYTIDNPVDTTGNGGTGNNNAMPCSPDSVYFAQQVLPILTSNCAMPGCHDAQSHEDGIILDNYTNIRNTGKIRLDKPAESKIYKVLWDPLESTCRHASLSIL